MCVYIYKLVYKYAYMHNKCKINSLAVTDQADHFYKTTAVVQYTEMPGQVSGWVYVE